jgi:hypothetical protein
MIVVPTFAERNGLWRKSKSPQRKKLAEKTRGVGGITLNGSTTRSMPPAFDMGVKSA